jgi:hypothetical protein
MRFVVESRNLWLREEKGRGLRNFPRSLVVEGEALGNS